MKIVAAVLLLASGVVAVACQPAVFSCATDGECGSEGTCEDSGSCSFPDDACVSGRRYGAHGSADAAGECVPPWDIDPSQASSSSDSDTESGTESGYACSCELDVPPGWLGPVALAPADACEDAVIVGFDELDAPEAACECACDGAAACGGADLWTSAGKGCFGAAFASAELGACTDLEDNAVSIRWNVGDVGCVADDRTTIAPATMVNELAVCSTADANCYEGECGTCIHRDGVHECPDGYDDRVVLYESFTDERGCTECECMPGGEIVCAAQLYADTACEFELTNVFESVGGDACLYGEVLWPAAVRVLDNSSCEPKPSTPTGAATPTDPVTVCCL